MADKRTAWARRLKAWERSGQTRVAFCAAQGLSVSTFDYWRRTLRVAPGSALVPVVVASPQASAAAPIEVMLCNGIRLLLPPGSDVSSVQRLVEVLQGC